jgi:CRISPR-associated protein Csx17
VEDLLFGLSWIDFHRTSEVRTAMEGRWFSPVESRIIPRAWCLLKLLFLPQGVPVAGEQIMVRPEPSILGLLRAGRVGDACRIACRRLYATGLAPVQPQFPDVTDGTRLAASLLVPLRDVQKIVKRVLNVTSNVP